ncbi:EamA family transporter [Oscillatoria sp. FACHB-1407]|uniref:EamA family transporter n=1 Tax=Oscillatoria sp. FACHB-1407 TaxID=2692847 RepID=UPI001683F795|nr:EamA family transporter [Oscillatoria sp. FACHB-1407]MBD2465864.1 EamA family transporter [Oscillatoria sp. FACHB-1407]
MLDLSTDTTTKRFSSSSLGLVAILFTVLFWAIAANVAYDLFTAGVNPLELAGASAMIATFGLAILHSFFGRGQTQKMHWKQFVLGLVLVCLIGADYIAIQQLPVAIAIVLLFTAPILVVLWTSFASRHAPSRLVAIALILSMTGVVLVSKLLESNLDQVNWFGIGVGLTTAIFFAAYIVLSEQLSGSGAAIDILLKTYAVASLFWLAYLFTQGLPLMLLTPDNFPKVLFVGIAGNLMPYLLFLWSIQRVQAERAAIVATLEPFVAAILAWTWFSQTLTILQIIGGVLIIVAVTTLQLKSAPPDQIHS